MKLRYAIPSLVAAGFLPARAFALETPTTVDDGAKKTSLFDTFKLTHIYTLASHSSHASHASHASHRSSSGGGYYLAPPPAPPALTLPAPAPLVPLSPNTDKARLIVIRVQTALKLFGYSVPIDGAVGPETRSALTSFQTDWKMTVTGTITPEVLDALGVAAN